MSLTIAASTIVLGVALAVLVDAHVGVEICLSFRSPVAPNTLIELFWLGPV